jgi:uncharacterized protein (TIRG00374 family)
MDSEIDLQAVPVSPAIRLPSYALAVRMVLALAVAAILMLAFVRLVSFRSVLQRLEHLSIGLALLCGLVFLSAYCVRALRWRWFLAPYQISAPRAVAIYQVAIFVNWLLPIRGGELIKGLLLRRLYAIPLSRSLPTVAMDKSMDLLPSVALLVSLPFLGLQLSGTLWVLLLSVLAMLALGVLFLGLTIWRRAMAMRILAWWTSRLPAGIGQRIELFLVQFVDTLVVLIRQPRLLLIATAYTAVALVLDALFCLLAFQAIGAAVPFPIVLYGYTFYNLAYVLPTPPGQIGSNEVVGLLVFSGLLGMNRTAVAAMFLFSHPWTALLMTASGLLSLSAMGLTLRGTLALRPLE